jgi:glycosyltransferase involved in cell wall biosynthesis
MMVDVPLRVLADYKYECVEYKKCKVNVLKYSTIHIMTRILFNYFRKLHLVFSKRAIRGGAIIIGGAVVEMDDYGNTFVKAATTQYLNGIAEAFGMVYFFAPVVNKSQPQYLGHLSDRVVFFPLSQCTKSVLKRLSLRYHELIAIGKAARKVDVALEFFPFAGGLLPSILLRVLSVHYGVYFGTDPHQSMRSIPNFLGRWRQLIKRLAAWIVPALADFVLVRNPNQLKKLEQRIPSRVHLSAPISGLPVPKTIRDNRCIKELITLLYVGVFSQRKGLVSIFEAIKLLSTDSIHRYRLILVGAPEMLGTDRCSVSELQEQCQLLGIQHLVDFHGYVDDMTKLSLIYEQADIFVFASIREGFPRVLEEALLCGLPVVAFKLDSIVQVLQPDVHVMFVTPGNISEFAHCIRKIASDSYMRNALIDAGKKMMLARYPLPVVDQHIALMTSKHSIVKLFSKEHPDTVISNRKIT